MSPDFEEEVAALNILGKSDYMSYVERIAEVNVSIKDGSFTMPYQDSYVDKLVYSSYQGCPEVGAELKDGRSYNVGIPIFDLVEKLMGKTKIKVIKDVDNELIAVVAMDCRYYNNGQYNFATFYVGYGDDVRSDCGEAWLEEQEVIDEFDYEGRLDFNSIYENIMIKRT